MNQQSLTKSAAELPAAPRKRIYVDQKTIKNAQRANSGHCMIADAIKEQIPDSRYVSVDIQTIRWSDPQKGFRYIYLTPRTCQKAILDFDQGVDPAEFGFFLGSGQVTPVGYGYDKKRKRKSSKKRRLVKRNRGGNLPDVVGGKPPPTMRLRREFGLRAFGGKKS